MMAQLPELKHECRLNERPVLMGFVADGRFWEDVLRNNDLTQRARMHCKAMTPALEDVG